MTTEREKPNDFTEMLAGATPECQKVVSLMTDLICIVGRKVEYVYWVEDVGLHEMSDRFGGDVTVSHFMTDMNV
ncbi:MAG: hypothetical protein M1827_006953 [Pycnora praestabilis]|nr:MAG: hypothetical protein M1827_006953 [Pycnora praestabilis]